MKKFLSIVLVFAALSFSASVQNRKDVKRHDGRKHRVEMTIRKDNSRTIQRLQKYQHDLQLQMNGENEVCEGM